MFMRKTITPLFVLMSCVTNAQFSIQPQIGLENSRTTIKSNEFASFSPTGMQFAPRLAARMNYKFKTGHGLFFGVSTSSKAVEFKFTDPQAARTTYTATDKGLQLHLEGGYQYSIKPIALGKAGPANRTGHRCGGGEQHKCASKAGCGQYSTSHCSKTSDKTTTGNKEWYMRIVPSAGIAFKPSGAEKIETESKGGQTTYLYKAGWNTAFIAGATFGFGSLKQSRFVVSINYLKSLGNKERTINTIVNGKPNTTSLRSGASGFNVSLGIPVNLKKNKSYSQKKECLRSNYNYQHRCSQYRIYPQ
jgi:hypothetical protein